MHGNNPVGSSTSFSSIFMIYKYTKYSSQLMKEGKTCKTEAVNIRK